MILDGGLLQQIKGEDEWLLSFYCPACKMPHPFRVWSPSGKPVWQWNDNPIKPTFSPSLLIHYCAPGGGRCHLFVQDGVIRYCSDSQHEMAGLEVELGPFRHGADEPPGE